MRIISFNANGIRSAAQKGFFHWFKDQDADILCLQETKAQEHQLVESMRPEGYHTYFFDAQKPGYSGVAIYTRVQPQKVNIGLGWKEADEEGRYIEADLGDFTIASVYLPSGSSSPERQLIKFDFLNRFEVFLKRIQNKTYILCGDWNIAHHPIDLKNWRANQKSSGFLPEERAWLTKIFDELGYIDGFRTINQEAGQYTWWSHRGQAWTKNVGWRIDYQILTPNLKDKIKAVSIYRQEKFSDHAPLIMDYHRI